MSKVKVKASTERRIVNTAVAETVARKEWLESAEGRRCADGPVDNPYLLNRLHAAFQAGWEAATACATKGDGNG